MKAFKPTHQDRMRWWQASMLAACGAVATLSAADAEAPKETPATEKSGEEEKEAAPELTPEEMFEGGTTSYNNWIEFSTGGFTLDGSEGEFQQRKRAYEGALGGIDDFHYQRELSKDTVFTMDGRALFDLNDYRLRLGVTREKFGYLRFSYDEFQVWQNGDGGFYHPGGAYYPLGGDVLELNRGNLSFEAGLTLENKPKVVVRYDRRFRAGKKSSTIWGITHPGVTPTKGLGPSFYDLDEMTDAVSIDVSHTIESTSLGLGLRYETGELDNALKIAQGPGEPAEQKITDRTDTAYDLFSVHAYSETWIKNKILVSTGGAFTDLRNDFSASRIYNDRDFDVAYRRYAEAEAGFVGLNGMSRLHEYVANLNFLFAPVTNLTVVPSLRWQYEDTEADFSGLQTLRLNPAVPFAGNSEGDAIDVRERIDLRYTGVTNWVFSTRAEWTQGQGDLAEVGGTGLVGGTGVPPIRRETEDERFFQKYSALARWYAHPRLTVEGGAYYKFNEYNYDHKLDSTANGTGNRYPAYLVLQDFTTYDAHGGFTLKPWSKITLSSRYEAQLSTVNTRPDEASRLPEVESSRMTSHIFSQNINWTPWPRLYLQAGVDYVLSETKTPASNVTRAILDAENNYWTFAFSSRFVVDDKTDLNVAYFHYEAENYKDNWDAGVPYGSDARQHEVTATVIRRLKENIRLKLKYGYFEFQDRTFGDRKNYSAHALSGSIQVRF